MLFTITMLASPAHAFCGTYVGQAGAELYNNASQVAVARQGERTTLTLVNDYQGDASEFALLIPVPEVLGEEDVRVLDQELPGRLDAYSAPRLVRYECSDFHRDTGDWDSVSADSGGAPESGEGVDDSVTVEASFSAGEYDIVILSADESGALLSWLGDNGYAVGSEAEELLGEYIAGGAKFFAAKVNLEAVPEGASYLSPLQFGYDSEVFSLPIRLGTLNASEDQDLILYVLSDAGQTHISNYPQVEQETDCMVDLLATAERPGWVLEYGWTPSSCDPCSGEPLTDEELQQLGWDGDTWEAYFSRIHMRYPAGEVDQDLVFYGSNLSDFTQLRYIEYEPELEDRFANCLTGWAEDPGSCGGGSDDPDDPNDDSPSGDDGWGPELESEPRFGCALPLSPGLPVALLALGMLVRRRSRSSRS
jgi:hypothetical protein